MQQREPSEPAWSTDPGPGGGTSSQNADPGLSYVTHSQREVNRHIKRTGHHKQLNYHWINRQLTIGLINENAYDMQGQET